ncbi:helix-turn-helix protein [Enhygromyxa salina]|uniref:Helix-turn-helix protein n=1 Tax=Enhygromyxa salina TaxID=215803 RepID=A0A2S9YCI4_9BACT|nr:helix-turn-helix transcriptional regulator [Enhygromyxa salina]PRQ02746.1 helix-turn-helix protein [Enhygromyxa salina]
MFGPSRYACACQCQFCSRCFCRYKLGLKGLRRARGLTQEDLAERSGLSADTIRRMEQGSFSPSMDTIGKLCHGLAARGAMPRVASRRNVRRGREAKTPLYRAYCKFWRQSHRRKGQARRREALHPGLLALARSTLLASYELGERDLSRELIDAIASLSDREQRIAFNLIKAIRGLGSG